MYNFLLQKKLSDQRIFICLFTSIVCITSAIKAQTLTWTGKINTDWQKSGNWVPKSIPSNSDTIVIRQGLINYPVISNSNAMAASININSGASLGMSPNGILTISNAGSFNNKGTFNANGGTIKFAGSGTVSGTISFNNININGAVDLGNACTINGELEIDTNGSVINNAPAYSDTSVLFYNTKTFTTTGKEWITDNGSVGFGLPANITISNSTEVALQGNHTLQGILQMKANSILSIKNHRLTLNGTIKGAGVIKGSSKSNLIINGSGDFGTIYFDETTDGETNVLNNITIKRTSGTVTFANKLNLLGTYKPSAGVLHTNDTIVFKSYSTQTARIDKGSVTGGYITGTVQVERFIPARRAWRFLTIPVTNDTLHIRTAWQEGVNNTDPGLNYANNLNPHPGYGTHISGDNDISKGFDYNTTANPSLKTWQQSITSWSVTAPPTISTSINDYPAYLIFIRGSRAVNLSQSTFAVPDSTKLRAVGFLNMGNITKTLSGKANDFIFLGNPYVSSIDLSSVLDSASNISGGNKFWIWDPKINSVGGYVAYDNGSITAANSYANSDEAKILQSGEAFLIQISQPSASVTFHEADKVSTESNVFGKNIPKAEVHVNLTQLSGDSLLLEDGATVQFDSKYSASVDDFDAAKLYNFNENILLVRGENTLAIELRPVPQNSDTLFYRLYLFQNTAYKLQIYEQNLPASLQHAMLIDKYFNTQTTLNFNDTLFYDFTSNTDTNSYRNRFMIVFTPSAPKSTIENYVSDKNIIRKGSISLYPNPVTANEIKLQFQHIDKGVYDVSVYNGKGQKLLVNKVEHNGGTQTYTVPINPSWQPGAYSVSIIDKNLKTPVNIQFVIQ